MNFYPENEKRASPEMRINFLIMRSGKFDIKSQMRDLIQKTCSFAAGEEF